MRNSVVSEGTLDHLILGLGKSYPCISFYESRNNVLLSDDKSGVLQTLYPTTNSGLTPFYPILYSFIVRLWRLSLLNRVQFSHSTATAPPLSYLAPLNTRLCSPPGEPLSETIFRCCISKMHHLNHYRRWGGPTKVMLVPCSRLHPLLGSVSGQ